MALVQVEEGGRAGLGGEGPGELVRGGVEQEVPVPGDQGDQGDRGDWGDLAGSEKVC